LFEIDATCAARRSAELGRKFEGFIDTVTLFFGAIGRLPVSRFPARKEAGESARRG
jgi:hypothetical protein